MNIEIFWLLGLVAIGFCTFLLGSSPGINTKDRNVSMFKLIVGWGIVFEAGWVGLGVLLFLIKMLD